MDSIRKAFPSQPTRTSGGPSTGPEETAASRHTIKGASIQHPILEASISLQTGQTVAQSAGNLRVDEEPVPECVCAPSKRSTVRTMPRVESASDESVHRDFMTRKNWAPFLLKTTSDSTWVRAKQTNSGKEALDTRLSPAQVSVARTQALSQSKKVRHESQDGSAPSHSRLFKVGCDHTWDCDQFQLFPDGVIRYSLKPGNTHAFIAKLRASMDRWETATGGRIRFVLDPSVANLSMTGTESACAVGRGYRPDLPGRVLRLKDCNLDHELGHLIGMTHEQQRIDRDRYIQVIPNDFNCDNWVDFRTCLWPSAQAGHGAFNYRSCMLYGPLWDPPPKDGVMEVVMTKADGSPLVKDPVLGPYVNVTPQDGSNAVELYALEWRWRRFRSLGRDIGPTVPLDPSIRSNVYIDGSPAASSQGGGREY